MDSIRYLYAISIRRKVVSVHMLITSSTRAYAFQNEKCPSNLSENDQFCLCRPSKRILFHLPTYRRLCRTYSRLHSMHDHLVHLRSIFQRIRDNNLQIQPDKSEFMLEEILYLRHIVSAKNYVLILRKLKL